MADELGQQTYTYACAGHSGYSIGLIEYIFIDAIHKKWYTLLTDTIYATKDF